MKVQREGRRPWFLLALLVLAFASIAAACGGDDDETSTSSAAATDTATETASESSSTAAGGEAITIGFLSNCEGPFGPFWETSIAGMNMALINLAGATATGAKPSEGVTGATIGGVPIEINSNYGCSDDKPEKALSEAKRLIEQEDVDILLGPLSGDEGIAVANYAKENPAKTFVNGTSGAQDTTLEVRAPNYFRWNTDGAQWSAGLGAYAYNVLGWKKVVTVADDYSFPYTQVAGFVAEFCSLGGTVEERIWPALGEEDYSSYIAQIPEGIDGFYLGVGGTGTVAFVKQYDQLKGNLGDKIMGGVFITDPIIQKELGDRIVGVTTAGPTSGDSTEQAWLDHVEKVKAVYPDEAANASSVFQYNYYVNMAAILQGIEAVAGDISDDQAKLQEAMAGVVVESPFGPIKLDDNRQAIATNFLQQIVKGDDGKIGVKTIASVPDVDQSFAGKFSPESPSVDRENPACEAGSPPPWTSTITK